MLVSVEQNHWVVVFFFILGLFSCGLAQYFHLFLVLHPDDMTIIVFLPITLVFYLFLFNW